ncbi:MAG: hypothetical protein HQM14_12710 [SAR324 cluster bacterium]|nr:hypothetical protein [SAR324 cluster bacterium]
MKKHTILWVSLLALNLFPWIAEYTLQQAWYRLFYLTCLAGSLCICYAILYMGESLRYNLLRLQIIKSCYSGFNFAMAVTLGVGLLGNLAIAASLLKINSPLLYKLIFLGLTLLSTYWTNPKHFSSPFSRLIRTSRHLGRLRWLWMIPVVLFLSRFSITFLPINGTEQLHNTLPYAKLLFRGVNFYEYNLDNHFLLLGLFESIGVFLLSLTANDFAYHIIGQQITFLLSIGGILLLISTFPYVLRRWPMASLVMAIWPLALNFAPTDTIAFKPDWLAVLSAFLATGYLVRQWIMPYKTGTPRHESSMWGVILFSALAVCNKLTAVNYVVFLLPASVLLSILQRKRIHFFHCITPLIFLLLCGLFFGKNMLWLGNPVYPGFQRVFPKLEHLSQTATFNTFQINKVTQKIPGVIDYIRGYTRFVEPKHHPEFLVILAVAGYLWFRKKKYPFVLAAFLFFMSYLSLICIMFYPDIYQRYVAFTYIILLYLTLFILLATIKNCSIHFRQRILLLFALIMLSHASVEANLQKSSPWWWEGISPREYRIRENSLTKFYFEINERCDNAGVLLNRKWRSFLYANFTTINSTDLPGDLYGEAYYQKHGINFVITPIDSEEIKTHIERKTWFAENFTIVSKSKDTMLWKRNTWKQCQGW